MMTHEELTKRVESITQRIEQVAEKTKQEVVEILVNEVVSEVNSSGNS